MKEKNIKNEMEYTLIGGYYIPNIKIGLKGFKEESKLEKYARLRLQYLKNSNWVTYQIMFMNGTLYDDLQRVQEIAEKRVDFMIKHLAELENVTEDLKATNQLEWVQRMNNIKSRAEEVILEEVVYEKV